MMKMKQTSPYECSATYANSVSLMRVCQPLPPRLKYANTSGDSRMVVACLVGACCLPRVLITACNSGNAETGLALLKKSSPNSITSPSLSYLLAFIACYLSFVGFSQTNHTNSITANGKGHHVQTTSQKTQGVKACFAVILTAIRLNNGSIPIKGVSLLKINAVLINVGLVFVGVVINLHRHIVLTINYIVKQIVITNCEKLLTNPTKTAYTNRALAKSSVSDWHRYEKVTQARHYFTRAIFVSAVSLLWWAVRGTKVRRVLFAVCQLVQSATLIGIGAVVSNYLEKETIMSKNQNSNLPIVPIAVINGKITLFTHVKLWFKGVRYA